MTILSNLNHDKSLKSNNTFQNTTGFLQIPFDIYTMILNIKGNELVDSIKSNLIWYFSSLTTHPEKLKVENAILITNILCTVDLPIKNELELLWGLNYLASTEEVMILNRILNSGKVEFFLDTYFTCKNKKYTYPLTKLIGSLTLLENFCQVMSKSENKFLEFLMTNFSYNDSELDFYTLWVLNNLCIDNSNLFIFLIQNGVASQCFQNYINSSNYKLRKEAVYFISNILDSSNKNVIDKIIEIDLFAKSVSLLSEVSESSELSAIVIGGITSHINNFSSFNSFNSFNTINNYNTTNSFNTANSFNTFNSNNQVNQDFNHNIASRIFIDNGGLDILTLLINKHPNNFSLEQNIGILKSLVLGNRGD